MLRLSLLGTQNNNPTNENKAHKEGSKYLAVLHPVNTVTTSRQPQRQSSGRKEASGCFTPSQPVWLYRSDLERGPMHTHTHTKKKKKKKISHSVFYAQSTTVVISVFVRFIISYYIYQRMPVSVCVCVHIYA